MARKPEKPAFYLYIGGGCFGQPKFITTFVIRTNDPGLTAAVTAGVRMLGELDGIGVKVTEDLIVGDPGGKPGLMELMENMWAKCKLPSTSSSSSRRRPKDIPAGTRPRTRRPVPLSSGLCRCLCHR